MLPTNQRVFLCRPDTGLPEPLAVLSGLTQSLHLGKRGPHFCLLFSPAVCITSIWAELVVLALSHSALTAGLQEAFLATFVFLENCFLAGGLLPALNLSFLKQISALFPGLVLTKCNLWLKGGGIVSYSRIIFWLKIGNKLKNTRRQLKGLVDQNCSS